MRIRVQQSGSSGTGEQEPLVEQTDAVTLLGGSVGDDVRHRPPVHPFSDQHVRCRGENVGNTELRIAIEGDGELTLVARFSEVVEFLDHAFLQFCDQRLQVQAGNQGGEHLPHPRHLVEISDQRLVGSRILHLHGDLATVVPHRFVHLADGGGARGSVIEIGESISPVGTERVRENFVDGFGRHRRCGILEFRQRRPVRAGHLLGEGCLEDAHRLAELHRPALELTEDRENLLGGALLDLRGDGVRRLAAHLLPETPRGAPGVRRRKGRDPHTAGQRILRDFRHCVIVPEVSRSCEPRAPHR